MLVLSRRIGEQIVIDSNVTVTVVGCRGRKVRLGIDAPDDVPIRRHELPPEDAAIARRERLEPLEVKPR